MADPTWKTKMLRASFRGAPFYVRASEHAPGRRVARHIYPKRNRPYQEEMGREPREYRIEAFVIGDDYMTDRDLLIDMLEGGGAGKLVHPYYGEVSVVVIGKFPIRESPEFGGMAQFSIYFEESGKALQPAARTDTQANVATKAAVASTAAQGAFAKVFSMTGLPDVSAIPLIGGLPGIPGLSSLPSIPGLPSLPGIPGLPAIPNLGSLMSFGALNSGLSGIVGAAANLLPGGVQLSSFIGLASGISSNLQDLILSPAILSSNFGRLFDSIVGIVRGPIDAFNVLQPFFGFSSGESSLAADITVDAFAALPEVTQQTEINIAAVESFTQQMAVITAVNAAAAVGSFVSYDQAIQTRDALIDAIQAITEAPPTPVRAAVSDDVYYALTDLAAALTQDIAVRGATLPRLKTFTPGATLPALVIAWQAYQDASRDLEIVERNAVRNPGFVPGGQPLELLDV